MSIVGAAVGAMLVIHVVLAIQTGDSSSADQLLDAVLSQFMPLATLFVGYLFGRSTGKKSTEKSDG